MLLEGKLDVEEQPDPLQRLPRLQAPFVDEPAHALRRRICDNSVHAVADIEARDNREAAMVSLLENARSILAEEGGQHVERGKCAAPVLHLAEHESL